MLFQPLALEQGVIGILRHGRQGDRCAPDMGGIHGFNFAADDL